MRKIKTISYLIAALGLWGAVHSQGAWAQQRKRPFTVADDIAMTFFNLQGGSDPDIHFSPDGKYVAVWTERGIVQENCVEDSLRFYRTQDIQTFLKNGGAEPPKPEWVATLRGRQWPVIDNISPMGWRWLADSSGVAFVSSDAAKPSQQLMLADLRKKAIKPLTSPSDWVHSFDVRDEQHYVYVIADHSGWDKREQAQSQAAAYVGTGAEFLKLFFPDEPLFRAWDASTRKLWAVVDGKRFEVKHNGAPPDFRDEFMTLSPDGQSLAVIAPVEEVPPSWESLYPERPFPPASTGPWEHPIHAGHKTASQYVSIHLKSGSIQPLTDAPHMDSIGIPFGAGPAWSSDGQQLLLPDTFVKSKQNAPSRPCIAISEPQSNTASCAVLPKYGYVKSTDPMDDYHRPIEDILDVRFAPGDDRRILVTYDTRDGSGRTTEYRLKPDGTWQAAGETIGQQEAGPGGLELKVTQSVKDPQVLVAANKETSRLLWDPNPQLRDFDLAQASVYSWKDANGRQWEGGLYKPAGYQAGRRYPLVIQTHGFNKDIFSASGGFTTAMAAQELAASGIVVLQQASGKSECESGIPNEAPCSDEIIESAAKQLVSDGLADPEKIGIIGFSRTCYYVMDILTKNSLRLKAASITDGVMMDYFLYTLAPSDAPEKVIGAKPFGDGLQEWLKHSPSFNLDKVNTPLLVNALHGRAGALAMWSPYSELHYLNKPVELMVFNDHEHILTNPSARMASQGGTVDWFRFWLQDYEDPGPAKAEQYKRWRGLRQLQAENEKKAGASQAASR